MGGLGGGRAANLVLAWAAAALAWAPAAPARAAGALDPALDYRTLASARLRVHYPPGALNLAVRMARLGEDLFLRDAALFANLPAGPIDVVLMDNVDVANGSAQVLPKNTLRLFLAAPTELTGLSAYDDWLELLLVHELAHLCELDQAGGAARLWRALFGRAVAFNSLAPPWATEGSAVWAETLLTRSGRGRSSFVEMMLRTAALDDRFLSIDQAHRYYPYWPGGNVPYFYGGRFHLWLSDRAGTGKVADLHRRMASQPVPFFYSTAARDTLGASLPDLWQLWRDEEVRFAAEVRENVLAQGATESLPLTHHGGDIAGAQWSRDGSAVVYSRQSPQDGATVRRAAVSGGPGAWPRLGEDRHLVLEAYSTRLALEPGGEGVFFAQAAVKRRFDSFYDILRYDIPRGRVERVEVAGRPEERLRGRDPTLHPSGDRLLFVANRLHQSWLVEARFVGGRRDRVALRTVVGPSGDRQIASPAYAPNGRDVALAVWEPGRRRNIVLVDAESGSLRRRITDDGAEDGNPTWSPDGRWVLYESDQDGISNIYAFDVHEGAYWRVTRVVGGASMPAVHPGGRFLLFRQASGRGFDLHLTQMDRRLWTRQAYDPATGYRDLDALASAGEAPAPTPAWARAPLTPPASRAEEPPLALLAHEAERAYRPAETFLPFRHNTYLLPGAAINNGGNILQAEVVFGLATGGADVLGRHSWQATLGSSRYGLRPNWSVGYQCDRWLPSLGVQVADQAVGFPVAAARFPVLRSRQAQAGATFLLTPRHQVGAAYAFERRSSSAADAPLLTLGDLGSLEVGYGYQVARRFPLSISPEHGAQGTAGLRWVSRALGADFDELILSGGGRAWLALPWGRNHVFALRAAAQVALGPDYRELFYVGGTVGTSLFSGPAARQLPLRGLLGLPPGVGQVALYAEYRAPLWQIQRGLWTLPVVLQALHGALFLDAGNTLTARLDSRLGTLGRDTLAALGHVSSSVGAELRLDLLLGWNAGLTLRGGVALPWLLVGVPGVVGPPQFFIDLGTII